MHNFPPGNFRSLFPYGLPTEKSFFPDSYCPGIIYMPFSAAFGSFLVTQSLLHKHGCNYLISKMSDLHEYNTMYYFWWFLKPAS